MKERPILFSAPMVRALITGTKTQTRRVVKPQPQTAPGMNCTRLRFLDRRGNIVLDEALEAPTPLLRDSLCPYGQPGDRLWVRESHYLHGIWSVRKDDDGKRRWTFHPNPDMGAQFTEPSGFIKGRSTTVAGWYRRPSIHMPRWASRITLEVTGVRVERLQNISEADALAEGIVQLHDGGFGLPAGEHYHATDPRISYWSLWEHINGPGSAEANPWVWVVEFNRKEAA